MSEENSQRRGLRWLFCCGANGQPRERRPKRERRAHRQRHHRSHRHHSPTPSTIKAAPGAIRSDAGQPSIISDDDWHDALDAFSVGEDGAHSPRSASPRAASSLEHTPVPGSPSGRNDAASPSRRRSPLRVGSGTARDGGAAGAGGDRGEGEEGEEEDGDDDDGESSTFSEGGGSPGIGARLVSCLSIMRHDMSITGDEPALKSPAGAPVRGGRPPAGCSLQRRAPGEDPEGCSSCWDECDATLYQVRSVDYMRTRVKASSDKSIYRLVAVDVFRADAKAFHVARLVSLPHARDPVVVGDVALPPLLVFNVQLPQYPAGFFGPSDGPGQSIVYYFALPDDFDPARFENQAALGLLQRFVSNGRESDGSPTRERLKMIVRCVNADEWAQKAPLSTTEHRLLLSYNEKPVLTRPQHFFYVGPNYLEVDMDVHSYAFLARKALNSYHARLKSVVWDNAFVLQGNAAEELPEQVLGCGRIYRTDFEECRPLSDYGGCSVMHSRAASLLADPLAAAAAAAAAEGAADARSGGGAAAAGGEAAAAAALASLAAAEASAEQLAAAAAAAAAAVTAPVGRVAVVAEAGC